MPILTRPETVEVPYGMRCDCCGRLDRLSASGLAVSHVLGYGSPLDGTRVEAAICDDCLVAIVLERIPGAVFRDRNGHGEVTPREEVAAAMARKLSDDTPQ